MTPNTFKESNAVLTKPKGMTDEECSSLPICRVSGQCISKWKMSFKERMHCLFKGYVWVSVFSGNTQPPILILAKDKMFKVINE